MIDILRKRRSIRKYKEYKIKEDKKSILKEALLRAPTSRNLDPCQFLFIENKNIVKQLSKAKPHGISFLKDAPLAVLIIANPEKSDTWVEDSSIASILLQLTAQKLSLGSCWIQIRNRYYSENKKSSKYIIDLLNLSENLEVESIIALGYPAEEKEFIPEEDLSYNKISTID